MNELSGEVGGVPAELREQDKGFAVRLRRLALCWSSLDQNDSRTRYLMLVSAVALSAAALVVYFELTRLALPRVSLAVILAIFASATMSSVAGFAFSAICGAFLFHILGRPVRIVEIMIVCSIAIQLLSVITLRHSVDWRSLARFVGGGLPGLPLGVMLLTHASASVYLRCMGVFLILYGGYMLFREPLTLGHEKRIADLGVGFVGGITGGFAGFPGAFVTIWCGLKGWSKERQRGIYQPYILIMQVLALALLLVLRPSSAGAVELDVVTFGYIPAALLGTWCGIAIFRRLTDLQFVRLVNLLLVASGIGLIS